VTGPICIGSEENWSDNTTRNGMSASSHDIIWVRCEQVCERLNNDSVSFNKKLNATSKRLRNHHSGLILVVLDMYQPLLNLATNPTANGTWITSLCSLKHVNL
jgi:hypothetical protein